MYDVLVEFPGMRVYVEGSEGWGIWVYNCFGFYPGAFQDDYNHSSDWLVPGTCQE